MSTGAQKNNGRDQGYQVAASMKQQLPTNVNGRLDQSWCTLKRLPLEHHINRHVQSSHFIKYRIVVIISVKTHTKYL